MKKLIALIAFLAIGTQLFAQTQKVYLNRSGKLTADVDKAAGYLLVEKLNDNAGYLALQYDIKNNLISKGTYKDEALTMPGGKFVYYSKVADYNGNIFQTAANNEKNTQYYTSKSGYFVDGKRSGLWVEYAPSGQKIGEYTFENGVLNGPYKVYSSPTVYGEGTAVNGQLQGEFSWYSNGLRAADLYYQNGRLKSKNVYLKPASENESLKKYVESKLYDHYLAQAYNTRLNLKFTVDKTGKIVNPQIEGYKPEADNALQPQLYSVVLAALSKFDGFRPATCNGVPVSQEYTTTITLYNSEDERYKWPQTDNCAMRITHFDGPYAGGVVVSRM